MYRFGKVLVVVAALSLVATACGTDDVAEDAADPTTTEEQSTTTAPEDGGEATAVTIVADDYVFSEAPAEIEAGLVDVTFENVGGVEHELALVEIGDTPIDQVGEDLAPTLEGGPFPDYVENLAIPLVADGGETVTSSALVAEGNYALICTFTGVAPEEDASTTTAVEGIGGEEEEEGPRHYDLGMIRPLTVTAGEADATLPESESSVTARDYSFDVDVSAGRQTVNFTNEGPDQVHHAVFFPFNEGVDEAAAEAALDTFLSSEDEQAPPPPEIDLEGLESSPEFGVFSTGLGASYDAEFESGRTYAVVCFIQDRAGGPPHVFAHDMKEIFTVE
ncbi:MAG TPA: hypothetical protein VGV93_06840 [Acidimicrobiales bacterium]|nr:hypothetical protein [Acidimicrobiales bacterium]